MTWYTVPSRLSIWALLGMEVDASLLECWHVKSHIITAQTEPWFKRNKLFQLNSTLVLGNDTIQSRG